MFDTVPVAQVPKTLYVIKLGIIGLFVNIPKFCVTLDKTGAA